jgi:rSAM/selenodomain-associated transferase 1
MQPHLSPQQSLELHEALVCHTCKGLLDSGLGPVEMWVAGDSERPFFNRCVEDGVIEVRSQVGDNLGERMANALAHGLARFDQVVLVGSDCVQLDKDYLQKAFDALDETPVVYGPASDGGYVLIGMTGSVAPVFTGVCWGSELVMQQSRRLAAATGNRWVELATLSDVDRYEDLALLEGVLSGDWS